MDLVQTLVDRFPMFDPGWDAASRAAWFEGFDRLVAMAEARPAPAAAPQAAVDDIQPSTPEPGKRVKGQRVPDDEVARWAEMRRSGLCDAEISHRTGRSASTIHNRLAALEAPALEAPFRGTDATA